MAYHGLHSCLWFAICLTVVVVIAGVSHSDSVLNSLCDSQKCVCQINVAPGSNGCQSDDSLARENARMNETIWLLQDEIRRLKGGQGNYKNILQSFFCCFIHLKLRKLANNS